MLQGYALFFVKANGAESIRAPVTDVFIVRRFQSLRPVAVVMSELFGYGDNTCDES